MKRLGNVLFILAISFLIISVAHTDVFADPTWAPTLTLPNDTSLVFCEAGEVCYDVIVSDPDASDSLYLSLLEGPIDFPETVYYESATEPICFTPEVNGDYRFVWQVRDTQGHVVVDTVVYTVTFATKSSLADQLFSATFCAVPQDRVLEIRADSPQDFPATYELISGPGSIDPETGDLTYTVEASGVTVFEVAATNFCGGDTATIRDSVNVNEPPSLVDHDTVITLCSPEEICFDVIGTDPEHGPVTIVQTEGPGQFTMLTDSSGQTCFMPEDVDSATYWFYYCLADECPLNPTDEPSQPASATPPCYPDSIQVTVLINQPPVIVCPDPQTFYTCEMGTFCFDVDAMDPEFGDLTYSILSDNATIDGKTVCVVGSESAQFDVKIEVMDECGNADTCTVPVTIEGNRAPYVTMADDFSTSLCQPEAVCLDASADDPDFNIEDITVNYGYYDKPTNRVCFDADTSGTYMIILTATDSCGTWDSDTTLVTVTVNQMPVVSLGDDFSVSQCDPEEICADVNIADDNIQNFYLSYGQYNAETGQICFTPDTAGTYEIVARIVDDCEKVAEDTLLVDVTVNSPPVISGFEDDDVYLCTPQYVCIPVSITDADGDIKSITVNRGTYKDGQVCFVPYSQGAYKIILTVTDECHTVVDTAVCNVRTDQSVAIECPGDTSIFLCEPDTLCFPVGGIPDDATVSVSGTAAWWDAETQSVCFYSDCCVENKLTVNVTTPCQTHTCSFTVNVQTNSKPLVIIPQDTTVEACGAEDLCIPVGISDIDDNITDVSVEGASYDAYRKVVCFTPDTSGTYVIKVTATDSCGATDSDQMVVNVQLNRPPELTYTIDDPVITQCELGPISVGLHVDDPDGNIEQVRVASTTNVKPLSAIVVVDAETGEVIGLSFEPQDYGEVCLKVVASDVCGAEDTADICVTVNPGESVAITCPVVEPVPLCEVSTVCVPVEITGTNYQVTTDFGTFVDGQVCFEADTSGTYSIKIIASAECNADTCDISVPVTIAAPVVFDQCPADTNLFVCEVDTAEIPFVLSGDYTNLDVSAPAYILDGKLYVPILEPGTLSLRLTATGECSADTCDFDVSSTFNSGPVVTARDTSVVLCEPEEICIPYNATDVDENIVSVEASIGTLVDGKVCFTPDEFGDYETIITATDECGVVEADTVLISVVQGSFVDIICPIVEPATVCGPGQVCFPIEITGKNYTVTPSYGTFEDGELCFEADTSGVYEIKVRGNAGCNTDSCTISMNVTVVQEASIACIEEDTTLFYCDAPSSVELPLPITGDNVTVTTQPTGVTWAAGTLTIPYNAQTPTTNVRVIARNSCGADTCSFAVTVDVNDPPVLSVGQDTTVTACELEPICIPFSASDPNGNLVEVRATLGLINDTILCFTPPAYGDYQIILTAVDSCEASMKDTVNVSVIQGGSVAIDCPGYTLPVAVETPDTARIPLTITPADAEVTVSPFGYYDSNTGEVVAYITTPGEYTFTVTAEAYCNSDACDLTIDVSQYFPPTVNCTGSIDTVMCLTEPTTVCMPVAVAGTGVQVKVNPAGTYSDGEICVPVDTLGTYEIEIIAFNETQSATCYSTLSVLEGAPPTVSLPDDFGVSLCEPGQICVPLSVERTDFGVENIFIGYGTYNESTGEICADVDTAGVYTIFAEATDSCGNVGVDTVLVTVGMNTPPVVDLGDDRTIQQCEPSQVCIDVGIEDTNVQLVTTNIGQYDAETGQVCFVPGLASSYEIIVEAIDSCGASDVDTVNITVDQNHAPEITPMADTTVYLCNPQYVCLPVDFSDPDDNITSVTVNRGQYKDGEVCFVPYASGAYKVILTVTDECGLTAVDTAVVTVKTDQDIVVTCPNDTSIFLCEADTLCFPVSGVPADAQVTVGGTATWWDAETQSVCFFSDCCLQNTITVQVKTACATHTCSFTVNVQTNSKPLVIIPQDTTIVQCELAEVCIPVGVDDMDKNLAQVTVEGATYDAYRNRACFTPEAPGTYVVTVTAVDSCGAVDSDEMTINIIENREPSVIFTAEDSVFKQCEFSEVCLPVQVDDLDKNVTSITVNHGTYDADAGNVCFMPDSFGVYCITVTARDACGLSASDELCVRVAPGDYVSIECYEGEIEPIIICEAGTACLPLTVTGDGFTVTSTLGEWTDGQLCFEADTTGTYTTRVIATAQCSADTCDLSIPVTIPDPVEITCPGNKTEFLCEAGTVCYDFTVSSSVTTVTASAPAYINGTTVCVPIDQPGPQTVRLIAEGLCKADTCAFTVNASFNNAPVVSAGKDTNIVACSLDEVCLPISVTDADDNIASVTSTMGTVNDEHTQVCFTPETYGVFSIIVTVTDDCEVVDKDTVVVTYSEGGYASITCPDDNQFAQICGPDWVCIVAPIEPADAKVTISPNGKYEPATGEICVYVEEGGTIPVKVIAEAECSSDTCEFALQVDLGVPPTVDCPEQIDTLMCLAETDTLCFPVTVTGTGVTVAVKPAGRYSAGQVCVPIPEAGDYEFSIIATGACGADTCETSITVEADQEPVLTVPGTMTFERCPDDTDPICIDGIFASDVEADVTISQTCGEGEFTAIRPDSGYICFVPTEFGTYQFCVEATDGCHTVTKNISVDVVTKDNCDVCARLSIDGGDCTPVGLRKQVALNIDTNDDIAAFELLLSYDASALTFINATTTGTDIQGYEYFTYNLNHGACGTACPSGLLRLVGIADVNNGAKHPPDSVYSPQGAIAYIEFQIANDQNLGNQFVPISWVWFDCGDNTLSDRSGSLLYMDLRIFDAELNLKWDEQDDVNYPESARQFGLGAPDDCLGLSDKGQPVRCVEYVNGGICIIDPGDIDDRGDINLDGLAYTIADVVVFTNYFVKGLNAFTISIPGQIAATDVNADGLTLTVADLTYLIRVVVNDADPIPKPVPHSEALTVATEVGQGTATISTEASDNVGAAYLVYDVDPGVQIDAVNLTNVSRNMDLKYSVDGGKLKILLYDIGSHKLEAGRNDILQVAYSGSGKISLDKAEVSDFVGRPYTAKGTGSILPDGFALDQNYPNPFNPSTNISFTVPQTCDWRLSIFNINGSLVREFDGSCDAGRVEVVWDGKTNGGQMTASGVYLYRLEAGTYKQTRKMILLK